MTSGTIIEPKLQKILSELQKVNYLIPENVEDLVKLTREIIKKEPLSLANKNILMRFRIHENQFLR